MKNFYFKYRLDNGDGAGKGWTNDINKQQSLDPDYGYMPISGEGYATFDPTIYYYADGMIQPKVELKLSVDKPVVECGKEKAIISWKASKPVKMLVNNHPHPTEHDNQAEVNIKASGVHKFRILDSRHYSDTITIMAEDYGRD